MQSNSSYAPKNGPCALAQDRVLFLAIRENGYERIETKMEHVPAGRTQRIYARLAGFLFLWSIIIGLGGAPPPLPHRGKWNVRRNSKANLGIGALISSGAL